MSTTFTYLPDTEDSQRKRTGIFSIDDISASTSKENPELFGSVSVEGQSSHREIYTHFNFTTQHSNLKFETSNLFNTPRGISHHWWTGIFDGYRKYSVPETLASQPTNRGRSDSLDTKDDDKEEPKTPTHTPHRHDPDDDPSDNQPDGLRGPGGPGGPDGPDGPNGPGSPGGLNLRTKVKKPDTFNSLDLQKLKAFIVSLQLNFNDRPVAFAIDASKVNYTIFFLSGTTLDWFESDILCLNL
ncbi:uncharacterized protein ARMOST_03191 [Armillaria ostoyae]|uniref:Uncharacterized protein n=1 Tax=Armillaria ostoyae TaxID=47428 RepID=A0A284QTS9_ARMOS|nr:uncharacterized protein ARMOST_03191 [Armillaria ostoyae]